MLIRLLQNFADNFRHAQQICFFQAFRGADDQSFRAQMRTHTFEQLAAMLRGHCADDDLRFSERSDQIIGDDYRFGYGAAGEKGVVEARSLDVLADLRIVRPQVDSMRAFASQNNRKRGSPGAGSDDGDLAHARFDPRRLSVCAIKRRMFSRCMTMISREAKKIRAKERPSPPYSRKSRTKNGKAATAAIDPSDT